MRSSVYRIVRGLNDALLAFFLIARLLSPYFPAWSSQQYRLGIAILLLCGARFVFVLIDLARGALLWQRAIFSFFILLAVASMFGGHWSSVLVKIAAAMAETGILAFVIYTAATHRKDDRRSLEERLIEWMQMFFPLPLARIAVSEMMIFRAAIVGLFRRRQRAPQGFSYVESSLYRILPLLLLFGAPPDIFITGLVLKALKVNGLIWPALLAGTYFYTVVWAYGTLVTMRARPHEITSKYLHVRKGIFGSAAIALDSIRSATALPPSKSRKREGTADLSLRGTSKIEIQLSKPTQVTKWFVPDMGRFLCVTVSADDPHAMCRAIERHRIDSPVNV